MGTLAWLHLSDWHHKEMDEDRTKLRDKLLKDIRDRAQISPTLSKIDTIFFSGDISFSGQREQFDSAKKELITPISAILGKKIPVFCVPGNHDVDRDGILKIPAKLRRQLSSPDVSREELQKLVCNRATVTHLNLPFKNFYKFCESIKFKYNPSKLYRVARLRAAETTIGIICINTAWNSARFRIHHHDDKRSSGGEPRLWDYGLLKITESQLQRALNDIGQFDLGILVMHHPLHWIDEAEQAKIEQMLYQHCHIILHGHEHRPNMTRTSSAFGELVFIPAGASFNKRMAPNPMFTNAYNFCVIDTEKFSGTVYHRMWSEVDDEWVPDERFWSNGESHFFIPKLKRYEQKRARKSMVHLNKKYFEHVYKRVALEHEVSVKHQAVSIGNEDFVEAHIKIKIRIGAGAPEPIEAMTRIDPSIAQHCDAKVRKRAYTTIDLLPTMTPVKGAAKEPHIFARKGVLDSKEQLVLYEFKVLDRTHGFWFFTIKRFTEKIKFSIRKAKEYEYSTSPLGGFPGLTEVGDELLEVDTSDLNEMSLPYQGYLIVWKPRQHTSRTKQSSRPKKARVPAHLAR